MAATQKHRTIAVASPLGADTLLFRRMEAREHLSQPFEFHLDLFSENPGIKFTDVLGQPMVVRLNLPKEERVCYFHGLVSQFRQIRGQGRYAIARIFGDLKIFHSLTIKFKNHIKSMADQVILLVAGLCNLKNEYVIQ